MPFPAASSAFSLGKVSTQLRSWQARVSLRALCLESSHWRDGSFFSATCIRAPYVSLRGSFCSNARFVRGRCETAHLYPSMCARMGRGGFAKKPVCRCSPWSSHGAGDSDRCSWNGKESTVVCFLSSEVGKEHHQATATPNAHGCH